MLGAQVVQGVREWRGVGAQRLEGLARLGETFGGRSLSSSEQVDGPFDVALVGEQSSCCLDLDAE